MNNPSAKRAATAIVSMFCFSVITGCAADRYGPRSANSSRYGAQDSDVSVTIDQATFTNEVRQTLSSARNWAVLSEDEGGAQLADALQSRGGIRTTFQRTAIRMRELTEAQLRDTLRATCANAKADVVMLVEASSRQSFQGRMDRRSPNTTFVFNCATDALYRFSYAAALNRGAYPRQSAADLDLATSKAFANQLLTALGK